MVLTEPQPTALDLSFRLFGFPVRVHPLFWVSTLLLGNSTIHGSEHPLAGLTVWVWVTFVSILVHELGHAFAFRWSGAEARIWLHWFGGLAVSPNRPESPRRSIVISLAGPSSRVRVGGGRVRQQPRGELADSQPVRLGSVLATAVGEHRLGDGEPASGIAVGRWADVPGVVPPAPTAAGRSRCVEDLDRDGGGDGRVLSVGRE
jgi:hypothetical protein